MSLHPVEGHEAERAALAAAVNAGNLPNSLLFHGPAGTGKQRVALWLAQLLLCTARTADGPCGTCTSCRMALRLEHPDLHWYFPLPRPKGANADKLGEALEDARGAELASRRAEPLRPSVPDGLAGIFISHIHVLVRSAGSRPAMGSRKVFIIGDAEALVPQESSPEAANALLKLLEEPPADTTIILTASDPEVLLPTIRSRLLPVRFRSLPPSQVATFLMERAGRNAEEARRAAALGEGSIGRALAFLPVGNEPGPLEAMRAGARDLLAAALDPSAAARLAAGMSQSPAGARGSFSDTLAVLTVWLRDLAAAGSGARDVIINADAAAWLTEQAERHPSAVRGVPQAILAVEATLQLTQLNINPQLALASLLRTLHRHLVPEPLRPRQPRQPA